MVWKSLGIVLHSMGDRSLIFLVLAINISPGCKDSKEHLGALVNVNRLMTLHCACDSQKATSSLHPDGSYLLKLGRSYKNGNPSSPPEVHCNSKL